MDDWLTEETSAEVIQFPEDIRQSVDDNLSKVDQPKMENVGEMLERCVLQVSRLETQREDLLREFLTLREPMTQAVDRLRGNLVENQRLLTLARMDHEDVLEKMQEVKRKLFKAARDGIRCQVTLAELEYQVAQDALTEEELKSQIQDLTEELLHLQESHRNRLHSLRDRTVEPFRPRAASDVGLCRQASVRLQRRLSVNVQNLESWYEPRLIALLKRRQFGEKALRASSEQGLSFRAQLEPLRQEVQRLEENKGQLELRINLKEQEREELIAQHKEAEEELKQELGKLALDIEIKKRQKKDLEALTNDILEEMAHLKSFLTFL
ncbi:syncoilin-like [Stigmatopora argus]